jgi:hypothetical protein
MKSSRDKLTFCHLLLLASICFTLVRASLFSQKTKHDILIDGPSTVFTNRAEDVNFVNGAVTPEVKSAEVLLPRSSGGFIMDEDNSISGFLRRIGAKIFGRKQADSQDSFNLDPGSMSVPELFAALSNMPASKFDKIADQLISETFGSGTVDTPPVEFFSGLGLPPPLPPSNIRQRDQDPRHGSASSGIASILPPLGLLSQSLGSPFGKPPPPPLFPPSLTLSTVMFPVFVPKDQPLTGTPRSLSSHNHNHNPHENNSNNHNDTAHFSSSSSPAASSLEAASHSPLFAFHNSAVPPHHSHHPHHPDNQLQMDQEDMTSLVAQNFAPGPPISQHSNPPQPQHQHQHQQHQARYHHHPLDSLSNLVHSGYLHDISKISQQPFPLSQNRNPSLSQADQQAAPSSSSSSPAANHVSHNNNNDNGGQHERGSRQQDRWFADQATQVRSDTRSSFLPPIPSSSSSSSLLTPAQLEHTIMASTKAVVDPAAVADDSGRHNHHQGKAYPILDTSSSTPRIFHAPHNPADILKIFATAYDTARALEHSRNPSLSRAQAPAAATASGPVNHLQRASGDHQRDSLEARENKVSMTTTIASFPVFMKDDSVTTSTAPSVDGLVMGDMVTSIRPREFVTYLS